MRRRWWCRIPQRRRRRRRRRRRIHFSTSCTQEFGENEDSKGPKKDIRAARKTDKGKCWREGTFVRVYICTTIRTIYEG